MVHTYVYTYVASLIIGPTCICRAHLYGPYIWSSKYRKPTHWASIYIHMYVYTCVSYIQAL